jgi:glycosyltransferase involved in cell wall biosynthesis
MPDAVNDQRPLVTIITVTYNSSVYVQDAIESVLSQSYAKLEYIIGDDCSTDDTWDIITRYKDPRIKAYRNETNLREYPNRNKAISMATGKYLLFIDGDDLIYPHGIEFMVRMAESFSDVGMTIMRSYHPKLFYPVEISSHDLFIAEYFDKSLLDTAFTNTLFKTAVMKEVGGLSANYISGDTYIRLKIAQRHKCLLINDNLTWWRQTPGQATVKHAKSVKGMIQSYEYKLSMLGKDCPLNNEERQIALRNLQYKILNIGFRMMLKGLIRQGFQLITETKLLSKWPLLLRHSFISIDPFARYSSVNPYRISLERHPYANPVQYKANQVP